jgi:acetolactate synthase-1/2/3 large subunit
MSMSTKSKHESGKTEPPSVTSADTLPDMPRGYKARIRERLSFDDAPNGVIETTGAGVILAALKNEGVDVVFGYPGGAVLPLYDALFGEPDIKHVLVRHEQGAAHAADAYARITGKVGVCFATSGPGATNLVTGIANAHMDSVPMVCITGQVKTFLLGKDSFQESDITGITIPITKQTMLVTDVEELGPTIAEAFYIARHGRPGPVLVDIPSDLQLAKVKYKPQRVTGMRSMGETPDASPEEIEDAARAISGSSRPILYCGGGAIIADAYEEVRQIAEQCRIPITTTLMGKGCIPEDHPLALGMLGMHGSAYANYAMQEADCVIAVGARFDDRVTGDPSQFLPNAKTIVHIDIDPSEIGKIVPVHIGIAGDVRDVVRDLCTVMSEIGAPDTTGWLAQVEQMRHDHPLRYDSDTDNIRPQDVVIAIDDLYQGQAIIVTDVGQHQMWAAQYCKMKHPRRWVTSGGLGTMGFGLPAAVGAKMAAPDKPVVLISGDGSIQMCMQEFMTAVEQGLAFTVAIMNNHYLGMVRQWQEMFYHRHYSQTSMSGQPDFVKLAEAFGCKARRVERHDEVMEALIWAGHNEGGPTVLDFTVLEEENVFPMVPAGRALHNVIQFKEEERNG